MKRHTLLIALIFSVFAASAATVNITPGSNTLYAAINSATAGDIIVLAEGEYIEANKLSVNVPLSIRAAEGGTPVVKISSRIEAKASLSISGLSMKSSGAAECIRLVPGSAPFDLILEHCTISGFTSKSIRAYNTDQSAPYVSKLHIHDCYLSVPHGAKGIEASKAEVQVSSFELLNSTIDGGAEGSGRMIYLQSTEGKTIDHALVDHCTFYNSTDTRSVYLANLNGATVSNSIVMNKEDVDGRKGFCLYGSEASISNCISYHVPVYGSGYKSQNISYMNPRFVDADNHNFQLYANSPAVGAGTDNSNLGDPRWGVSTEIYDISNDPYVPYKKPYSMSPTTNSVKVLWQMSEEQGATEAVVYYGTDPENLNLSITTDAGWNVQGEGYVHIVTLTGLQPSTRYYFTVGGKKQRYPQVFSTITAPEQGKAFRIFTISDIHGNARKNWENMQDFICDLNPDISLMNGDFVSSKGNDRNWNSYFFTPGEKFLGQVPVMSSAGNHETGDPRGYRWSSFYDYFHQFSHGTPEDSVTDPRGEAYFHFVYGNADVVMLNINGDESSPQFLPGSRQYQWADSMLNACTRPWIIVCHHVGMWTSGYHGQWSDEPKQFAPLFEKYAAKGKRIISLSGDDHSFEHLYKDGVHYVRPGCGRDANYAQQKQLKDVKYSMFYRQISCFSTLDMSADASQIDLTAYDSVGNIFYTYKFKLQGEEITPSVVFTAPNAGAATEDSVKLMWSAFDPNKDAKVAVYYSQTPNKTSTDGLTLIAKDLTTDRMTWQTRDIFPKGQYYVYATVTSGGKTYLAPLPLAITLLNDTTPPPAPNHMTGYADGAHYTLEWRNPTRLVHINNMLEDFSAGTGKMQVEEEDGATMSISQTEGALKAQYNISEAWKTSAANLIFDEPQDLSRTTVLTFRMKGDGTNTPLRLVCKNMSSGHEDWWYTESITLKSTEWKEYTVNMSNLSAFTWYTNTDTKNHMEGVNSISFSISTGEAASGVFYLDDISVSGDIYPAPDYEETVILRKDNGFPATPTDGKEVYRGKAEQFTDTDSDTSKTYYYAAFACDDRDNWSEADASAQWCTTEPYEPYTGVTGIVQNAVRATKSMVDGVCVITLSDGRQYNISGQTTKQ